MGRSLQQQIDFINGPGRSFFLDVQSKGVGINTEMDLLRATANNSFLGINTPFGRAGKNAADGAAEKDPTYNSAEQQQMAAAQVKIIDEQFGGDINEYKQFVAELAQNPEYANRDFFELVTSGDMGRLAAEHVAQPSPPTQQADPNSPDPSPPSSTQRKQPDTDPQLGTPDMGSRMVVEASGQDVAEYSEEVAALQRLLVEKGFDVGTYPEGHPKAGEPMIDGLEGPKTRAAIQDAAKGLSNLTDENGKTINDYLEDAGKPVLDDLENMPIEQMMHLLAEYGSELNKDNNADLDNTGDAQYTVYIQDPENPQTNIALDFDSLDDLNNADWDNLLADHGIAEGTDLSQFTVAVHDNHDGDDLAPEAVVDLGTLSVNEMRPDPSGDGYSMTMVGYVPPEMNDMIKAQISPAVSQDPAAPTPS